MALLVPKPCPPNPLIILLSFPPALLSLLSPSPARICVSFLPPPSFGCCPLFNCIHTLTWYQFRHVTNTVNQAMLLPLRPTLLPAGQQVAAQGCRLLPSAGAPLLACKSSQEALWLAGALALLVLHPLHPVAEGCGDVLPIIRLDNRTHVGHLQGQPQRAVAQHA